LTDFSAADDLNALTGKHLETLGMLIFQPSRYLQRVVEHLSFLPAGGERWQRDIQLRIPETESPDPPPGGRFIVSLGMFRRFRFPDFTVKDAAGERLTLVTRRQHQHAITLATIRQYLDEDDWRHAGETDELLVLYEQVASIITDIRGPNAYSPADVGVSAKLLMTKLEKSAADVERVSGLLEIAAELLSRYTHYLCWVPAEAGATLSLSATYTMSDTVRVAGERRKALDDEEMNAWTHYRTRFYASLGLFPVPYELRAPAHDHAGSYYLTIEPPEDAHVSRLAWGHEEDLDASAHEIDCAHVTCHIHNGERLTPALQGQEGDGNSPQGDDEAEDEAETVEKKSIAGAKISAFMRADPMDHAALIAVALLNLGLAYLAQRGEFNSAEGDSQQQWLLLAPTLVVALIAQHRRRYYSSVTSSVRIGLWIYLAINALFGASVAFDFSGGNKFDNVASGVMAVFSLMLLVLLIATGGLFERLTTRLFRFLSQIVPSLPEDKEEEEKEGEDERYLTAVRLYADSTIVLMAIVAILGLAGTKMMDWGEGLNEAQQEQEASKKGRGDGVSVHAKSVNGLVLRIPVGLGPSRHHP